MQLNQFWAQWVTTKLVYFISLPFPSCPSPILSDVSASLAQDLINNLARTLIANAADV